jgi:hypothetical protein
MMRWVKERKGEAESLTIWMGRKFSCTESRVLIKVEIGDVYAPDDAIGCDQNGLALV